MGWGERGERERWVERQRERCGDGGKRDIRGESSAELTRNRLEQFTQYFPFPHSGGVPMSSFAICRWTCGTFAPVNIPGGLTIVRGHSLLKVRFCHFMSVTMGINNALCTNREDSLPFACTD